jgi:hypothetical protein
MKLFPTPLILKLEIQFHLIKSALKVCFHIPITFYPHNWEEELLVALGLEKEWTLQ